MNSDLIAAIVVVALIFGTSHGRTASRMMWRSAGGPSGKQMRAAFGRKARTAPPLARRAGAAAGRLAGRAASKAGTVAQARWSSRTVPDPPVWRRAAPAPDPPQPESTPESEPEPAVTEQTASQPAPTKESTVDTEYELPSSDGAFLEFCQELARSCRTLGDAVEEHSSGLRSLGLSPSVTAHVEAIAQLFAEAAQEARAAAVEFEAVYEEPRAIAAKGMHFLGEDAA